MVWLKVNFNDKYNHFFKNKSLFIEIYAPNNHISWKIEIKIILLFNLIFTRGTQVALLYLKL